jgi:hypothetical protein
MGHQQIRLSKFPAVLMPRPFTPIDGTFSNFVGPVYAARLRIAQGIERNTHTDSTRKWHSTTRQGQGKTKAE